NGGLTPVAVFPKTRGLLFGISTTAYAPSAEMYPAPAPVPETFAVLSVVPFSVQCPAFAAPIPAPPTVYGPEIGGVTAFGPPLPKEMICGCAIAQLVVATMQETMPTTRVRGAAVMFASPFFRSVVSAPTGAICSNPMRRKVSIMDRALVIKGVC